MPSSEADRAAGAAMENFAIRHLEYRAEKWGSVTLDCHSKISSNGPSSCGPQRLNRPRSASAAPTICPNQNRQLSTRSGGAASACHGPISAQEFQRPLPANAECPVIAARLRPVPMMRAGALTEQERSRREDVERVEAIF
jgi:hypothetical protein